MDAVLCWPSFGLVRASLRLLASRADGRGVPLVALQLGKAVVTSTRKAMMLGLAEVPM